MSAHPYPSSWNRKTSSDTVVPPYVPVVLVLTAAYVLVEIPFSVNLVPFLADPDLSAIDQVEHGGRWLTGIAVALASIGYVFAPRLYRYSHWLYFTVFWSLALGLVVACAVFYSLDTYAKHVGSGSPGAERQRAYAAVITRSLVQTDGSAASQAIQILSPLIGVPAIGLEEAATLHAAHVTGDGFERRTLAHIASMARKPFADYEQGCGQLRKAYDEVDQTAKDKYQDMFIKLARNDHYIMKPGEFWYIATVASARAQLPALPTNWDPYDYKTFKAAVRAKAAPELGAAERMYREEFGKHTGGDPAPKCGLPLVEFVKQPFVQRAIRDELPGRIGQGLVFPGMSHSDFDAIVRYPLRAETKSLTLARLKASPEDFAEGGKYSADGRNAVQALQLPIMALGLSFAGAAFHTWKVLNLALALLAKHLGTRGQQVLSRPGYRAPLAAAMALAIPLLCMPSVAGTASWKQGVNAPTASSIGGLIVYPIATLQDGIRGMGTILIKAGPWKLARPWIWTEEI